MCVYIPFNTTAGIMPIFQSLTFEAGTTSQNAESSQTVNYTVPDDNTPGGDIIFNVQVTIEQPGFGLFDLDDITEATEVGQAIDSIVFTVVDDDC